jgi:predicted Zn-dependent protease
LIVVSTGLLRFAQSDDELAVVMGHELAHLTGGHLAKTMAPNLLAGLIGSVVGSAADIVFPGSGGTIGRLPAAGITAPFSKEFEREADVVGLEYAHRAGYEIEAGITFWDRFATELGQSTTPSYLNTHPTSPERLLRMEKIIEELKAE